MTKRPLSCSAPECLATPTRITLDRQYAFCEDDATAEAIVKLPAPTDRAAKKAVRAYWAARNDTAPTRRRLTAWWLVIAAAWVGAIAWFVAVSS